jgi:hypothetical protein
MGLAVGRQDPESYFMAATQLEARAEALDRRAVLLQTEAAALPSVLDEVASRSTADVWVGPAASRLSEAHDRLRTELGQSGDALAVRARTLAAQAGQLRARAAELFRAGAAALAVAGSPAAGTLTLAAALAATGGSS